MMDEQIEKEFERVDKRIDGIAEVQKDQGKTISKLVKDIFRFWHIGIGLAVGFLIDTIGIEKIITKWL